MKKQKITIETNGKHRGTKLFLDDQQVYFESLSITGSKDSDYDIAIGLSVSKLSQQEIKQQCQTNVAGFNQDDDEEQYDDYEDKR